MPDNNAGYLQASFDLSNYDPCSGMNAVQVRPFRLKKEPKWGTRTIGQIHWIYDEFLATRGAWESVFAEFSINSMPVLDHKTGVPFPNTVQLRNQGVSRYPLKMPVDPQAVSRGLRRYSPWVRGWFPTLSGDPGLDYFVSQEFFGSGGSSYRATIVSSALYRRIVSAGLRGVAFHPLEPV